MKSNYKPFNTSIPVEKPKSLHRVNLGFQCCSCGNLESNPCTDNYRCGSMFMRGLHVLPAKACCKGEFWVPLGEHDPSPEEMAEQTEFDGRIGDISMQSSQIIDYDNTWAQIKLRISKYYIVTDEDVIKTMYKTFKSGMTYKTTKVEVYVGKVGLKPYNTLRLRNTLPNGKTSWHTYDVTPKQVNDFTELVEAYMEYYALCSIEELGV